MLTALSRCVFRTATVLLVGGSLTASLQAGYPYTRPCSCCSAASGGGMGSSSPSSRLSPVPAMYMTSTGAISSNYGQPIYAVSYRTVNIYSADPLWGNYPPVDSLSANSLYPPYGNPYLSAQMQMPPQWPYPNPTAGNLFANPYVPGPYPNNYTTYPNYTVGNYPYGANLLNSPMSIYPYPANPVSPFMLPQENAGPMYPTINTYAPYSYSPGSFSGSAFNPYANSPGGNLLTTGYTPLPR